MPILPASFAAALEVLKDIVAICKAGGGTLASTIVSLELEAQLKRDHAGRAITAQSNAE
jgi:hypothetical protein